MSFRMILSYLELLSDIFNDKNASRGISATAELLVLYPLRSTPSLAGFRRNNNNNNNNNNNQNNVYGAVIMAEPLREFTRFTL